MQVDYPLSLRRKVWQSDQPASLCVAVRGFGARRFLREQACERRDPDASTAAREEVPAGERESLAIIHGLFFRDRLVEVQDRAYDYRPRGQIRLVQFRIQR